VKQETNAGGWPTLILRREVLALLGSAAVGWPVVTRAQQPPLPVIGFVNSASPKSYERPLAAYLKGLSEAGYVDGHNVVIEYRWADGKYEQLPVFVADFVQRKVDVIAATSTPGAIAAKAATTTIPVVFTSSDNPVMLGLVASLRRPGGNVTGATQLNVEVAPKRLELMHELLPAATNIGLLVNPSSPLADPVIRNVSAAATSLGLTLHVLRAKSEEEIAAAFASLAQLRVEALVIGSDVFFTSRSEEIAQLAIRNRLPTVFQYPEFTTVGGLISYGGDIGESYRMAGLYTGRILKGEKPANLPVQQVTQVELIINLKTAKTLGITFPLSILGRADEVIE
jgi:putative ABC transport system substrate-binding protein